MTILPSLSFLLIALYTLCIWVLLYEPGLTLCNNSHTSSTPIDLFEVPHIFYTRIIHIHCLRALTWYSWDIYIYIITYLYSPVDWGSRLHRLRLNRERVLTPHNKFAWRDIKRSGGQAPIQELMRIWSTPSLPFFLGPLWPGVVVPVRVPSMGCIEIFNHFFIIEII